MSLLKETETAIYDSSHSLDDIIFIGSQESGHECNWIEFTKLADFDYDSGYGSAEIATDLIIVFFDGSKLWRNEYDGSEWWEYLKPFTKPENYKPIIKLYRGMYETLEIIHKMED